MAQSHNQAIHRMPKPELRSGFATGDGRVITQGGKSMKQTGSCLSGTSSRVRE
jgi:hypothetical protein